MRWDGLAVKFSILIFLHSLPKTPTPPPPSPSLLSPPLIHLDLFSRFYLLYSYHQPPSLSSIAMSDSSFTITTPTMISFGSQPAPKTSSHSRSRSRSRSRSPKRSARPSSRSRSRSPKRSARPSSRSRSSSPSSTALPRDVPVTSMLEKQLSTFLRGHAELVQLQVNTILQVMMKSTYGNCTIRKTDWPEYSICDLINAMLSSEATKANLAYVPNIHEAKVYEKTVNLKVTCLLSALPTEESSYVALLGKRLDAFDSKVDPTLASESLAEQPDSLILQFLRNYNRALQDLVGKTLNAMVPSQEIMYGCGEIEGFDESSFMMMLEPAIIHAVNQIFAIHAVKMGMKTKLKISLIRKNHISNLYFRFYYELIQ